MKKLLANNSLHLVIALGTQSALAVHHNSPLDKPVISPQVDFPFYLEFLDTKTLKPKKTNRTTSYDPSLQTSLFYTLRSLFELDRMPSSAPKAFVRTTAFDRWEKVRTCSYSRATFESGVPQ